MDGQEKVGRLAGAVTGDTWVSLCASPPPIAWVGSLEDIYFRPRGSLEQKGTKRRPRGVLLG